MMQLGTYYPTGEHAAAAAAIVEFWRAEFPVEAVLLVNSCTRGKATPDSCLDIKVLARPDLLASELPLWEARWEAFAGSSAPIARMRAVGKFSDIHLDVMDAVFVPTEQDEAAGPDDFELGIGNILAYSVPLWQGSDYYARLQAQWLPYYDESLRRHRLHRARYFCRHNLHHIPLYLARGLYFQSFDRLYNAYQTFLQALFIARRTYPIAYNKWLAEQLVDMLQLPELYARLGHLFEIGRFLSDELSTKALELESLLDTYAPEP